MSLLCCLCRISVDGDHRKRKRLHGRSCDTVRTVICRISENALIDMMKEPNALLCNACEKLLNNIKTLEEKLEGMYSTIKRKLTVVHRNDDEEDIPRKRIRIQEESTEAASQEQLETMPLEVESFPISSVERHHQSQNCSQNIMESVPGSLSVQPSPPVKVVIPYEQGDRTYNIKTPKRKMLIKRGARKNYQSMAAGVLGSVDMGPPFVNKISSNIIVEMKAISSVNHDSFLRNSVGSVKEFEWEAVADELCQNMPTLMSILSKVIPNSVDRKPLQCMIASQLLKTRHPHMCLVQRVVSVMMYGNGVAKQLYANLQPLNICLTYQSTSNIVNKISTDHDAQVKEWVHRLESRMQKPSQPADIPINESTRSTEITSTLFREDTVLSESDSSDISAPSYSIITSTDDTFSELSDEQIETVHEDQHSSSSGDNTTVSPSDNTTVPPSDNTTAPPSDNTTVPPGCGISNNSDHLNCKYIIDNVDKNVKPSFQRLEIRGKSYHHVHGYCVQDRIDTSMLCDRLPTYRKIDASVLLPSESDIATLKDEQVILVKRMLVQHFDEYKHDAKTVPPHIPSKYSTQMSTKSKVVPLGVLLHNENKLNEMSHVLRHYMQFVPTVQADGFLVLPNGSKVPFDDTRFDTKLLGGDQLTVVRVRSTQALRDTLDSAVERYDGIVPVLEDWHTRVILLQVVWGWLYNTRSANELGTMYQLRNRINRTSVTKYPEKNVKATEDFLALMVHAHVITAAKAIKTQTNDINLDDLASMIVEKFTHLPRPDCDTVPKECEDTVFLYASEVLSLGLLWHGFHDAIQEADGERILNYWKFLLVVFKSTNHHNYAKEATNLLMQYYYNFSERQKAQLLWSRCVNTRGIPGANIPCDLHMEHLNRRLKNTIHSMGANITPSTIIKAGKALGPVHHVCQVFEEQTTHNKQSNRHKTPGFGKDLSTVLDILINEKVFTMIPGRQYKSFKSKHGLMEKLPKKKLIKRVEKSVQQLQSRV